MVNTSEENFIYSERLEKLQRNFQDVPGFSGFSRMCLMIILKVTKNQGFTPSLENTVLEKPQRGSRVKRQLTKGSNTLKQFGDFCQRIV